ncbi:MAG TPA: cupin domain-containing protein [Salinivirgaceae bacterium]|nr:cupin domain-containing protein [Salinivirgaceae bacterium]
MIKTETLLSAPKVPFDLDGRIMFTSSKAEMVHLTIKPGEAIPPHANPFGVIFYMLEGELELSVNDESHTLSPNTTAFVEMNESRSLTNNSPNPAKVLVVKIF